MLVSASSCDDSRCGTHVSWLCVAVSKWHFSSQTKYTFRPWSFSEYLDCCHSFSRKATKLSLFSLHERNAFQSLGIFVRAPFIRWGLDVPLLPLSEAFIDSFLYLSVTKSTRLPFGSLSNKLSASSPKEPGKETCACSIALPLMMFVGPPDFTWCVSSSRVCMSCALSVFTGTPSLVASAQGTGPKG